MKTIKLLLGLTILLTLVWSCEGPEGPEGPMGQTGAAGKDGKDGAKGIQGDKGNTGNANVKSKTYSPTSADWNKPNDTSTIYICDLPADFITSDIVNTGAVRVFMDYQTGDTTQWWTLPYTFMYKDSTNYFEVLTYTYYAGTVRLYVYSNKGILPFVPYTRDYRVVVISGTLAMINPQIKWCNYNELKKAYPEIGTSKISK